MLFGWGFRIRANKGGRLKKAVRDKEMRTRIFITAILIIQTSVSLAAYDSNSTNVIAGGYGYAAVNESGTVAADSWTAFKGYPALSSGILTIQFASGTSGVSTIKKSPWMKR
jgi:hypothetical protein